MLVRRIRRKSFAGLSDQARTVLASKLAGAPQLDVAVSTLEPLDLKAFTAAWNQVQTKCKQAGMEGALTGVRIQVGDEGRFTAKFQKGRVAVNLTKFSKNALAAELLAHELGRRFWATNLTEKQRETLKASHKDPEGYFAKKFRAKLFGKPKAERWEAVTL
jgi:hypothetical protein